MLHLTILGLDQFYNLASNLLLDNFHETGCYRRELELNIDWHLYANYEDMGLLKIVGSFIDKKLIGYSAIIKVPLLLHKGTSLAVVTTIYLAKEYRRGKNGIELIRYTEDVAKVIGCNYVTFYIPKEEKRTCRLLVNLGYKLREAVLSKRL